MFTGIVEGTGTVAALAAAADGSGARLTVDALVQGHVDGVARVLDRRKVGDGEEVRFELPPELQRYVVEKGSVAVDGVSLTVAGVGPGWFAVALVPHTLKVTTLGDRRPGDLVQLEVDVVAKYVERLVEGRVGQ